MVSQFIEKVRDLFKTMGCIPQRKEYFSEFATFLYDKRNKKDTVMWENVFWITIPSCSQLELIINLSRSDDSQFKQLRREIFIRTAGINFLSFHSISTVYMNSFAVIISLYLFHTASYESAMPFFRCYQLYRLVSNPFILKSEQNLLT